MKKTALFMALLLSTIYFTLPSFATKRPVGDVYPTISANDDQFIIYWSNTETGKLFRACYNLKKKKLGHLKVVSERPELYGWNHQKGEASSYLTPYFDMDCMFSFKTLDQQTIVGGVDRDYEFCLKLVVFDQEKKLMHMKTMKPCVRMNLRAIASNTEVYNDTPLVAWVCYKKNEMDLFDLVITRWILADDKLEQKTIQKNLFSVNTRIHMAVLRDRIGLVYSQPDGECPQFRVIFQLLNADTLDVIQTIAVPYTDT